MPRICALVAAILAISCPGFCATTNVADGNQLTAALSAAQPGDVIILAPGVYPGPYDFGSEDPAQSAPAAPCGSEEAPIIVRAATPADASLAGPAVLCCPSLPPGPDSMQLTPGPVDFDFSDAGSRVPHAEQSDLWGRLKLIGAQYITFEDLDLRGSGMSNVILQDCVGITFRRCRIRDASLGGLAIKGYCQDLLVEDCLVSGNGRRGGNVDGVMVHHGRGLTVRNSRFLFNSSSGMNVGGTKDVLFENNLVALNGLGWYSDTTGPGLNIRRELTHLDCLPKDVPHDGYTPAVIRNCLFYNNGSSNLALSGPSGADTSVQIIGNTFITRDVRQSYGSVSLTYDNGDNSLPNSPDDNPRNVDFIDNVFDMDNVSLGDDPAGCSVFFFTDATAEHCPCWQKYTGNTYITSHPTAFVRQHAGNGCYLDLNTGATAFHMQPRATVGLPPALPRAEQPSQPATQPQQ